MPNCLPGEADAQVTQLQQQIMAAARNASQVGG